MICSSDALGVTGRGSHWGFGTIVGVSPTWWVREIGHGRTRLFQCDHNDFVRCAPGARGDSRRGRTNDERLRDRNISENNCMQRNCNASPERNSMESMTQQLNRTSREPPLAGYDLRHSGLRKPSSVIDSSGCEMNRDKSGREGKSNGRRNMWHSQLVDPASPSSGSNCGEDLWLGDKATHRFRAILDRGASIGSAVRG